jgi:hypothetical protein
VAWALEAAQIFFVLCGCAASGWALGFVMAYRRGVDDAAVHDGIRAARRVDRDKKEPRQPATTGLSSQHHDAPRETESAIVNSRG